jgi:Cof subfamily protein (haloacid dehalogenase superfamily)
MLIGDLNFMNFPKLIATDLDGTILQFGTFISDRVFDALQAARDQGAILVIATGRSYTSIPPALLTGELFSYACVANGALTKALPSGKTIHKELTAAEDLIEPVRVLENLGFNFSLGTENADYFEERRAVFVTKRLEERPDRLAAFLSFLATTQSTPSILKVLESITEPIVKVNASQSVGLDNIAIAADLAARFSLEVSAVTLTEIEITSKMATKGKSLLKLASLLGIQKEDVIAFGDSGNDLSLIDGAGRLFAMGNGDPRIKEIAHEIALPIDQDGVAAVLEGFLAKV